LPQRRYREP
jgi:hypothetical protein